MDSNVYGYCSNSPIDNIDPTGYWKLNGRTAEVNSRSDTLYNLACKITGVGSDWKLLSEEIRSRYRRNKRIKKGTLIDITDLLFKSYQRKIMRNTSPSNAYEVLQFDEYNLVVRLKVVFHGFTEKQIRIAMEGVRQWEGEYVDVMGKNINVNILLNPSRCKNHTNCPTDPKENVKGQRGAVNIYKSSSSGGYTYIDPPNSKTYTVAVDPRTEISEKEEEKEFPLVNDIVKHELGHVFGLDDAYDYYNKKGTRVTVKNDPRGKYGIPCDYNNTTKIAMANNGTPCKQEIAMVIMALAENEEQYFTNNNGKRKVSKALRLYYQ